MKRWILRLDLVRLTYRSLPGGVKQAIADAKELEAYCAEPEPETAPKEPVAPVSPPVKQDGKKGR